MTTDCLTHAKKDERHQDITATPKEPEQCAFDNLEHKPKILTSAKSFSSAQELYIPKHY